MRNRWGYSIIKSTMIDLIGAMEQNIIKFSFVIPAFKIKYLNRVIESILNQTYQSFELIVVNDASPENLSMIVNSYNDERLSYYENEVNIGKHDLIENWNQCVDYAKGEYLILASDDDVYLPNFLQDIYYLICKNPFCDVFRGRVQRINSLEIVTSVDYLYPEFMSQSEYIYYWAKGMIKCISNYVFRREHFLNKGKFIKFPLAWFSDDSTVIVMSENGVVSTKDTVFQFRSSDINISMDNKAHSLVIKLSAINLFYQWIFDYLKANNLLNDDYLNPSYNIHKYLFEMIFKIISNLKYSNILFVIRYLFNN